MKPTAVERMQHGGDGSAGGHDGFLNALKAQPHRSQGQLPWLDEERNSRLKFRQGMGLGAVAGGVAGLRRQTLPGPAGS